MNLKETILKINKKYLILIIIFVLVLLFIFLNVPSYLIDVFINGKSCNDQQECWDMCEKICKFDIIDRVRNPFNGAGISNCENGVCIGCDCCWGCVE